MGNCGNVCAMDKQDSRTEAEAEVVADAKASLPPFDPFFPISTDSKEGMRLRVPLAHLQYETQEKAKHVRLSRLSLEMRRLKIEADKQVKL